ncbi:hypothetical protein AVEN_21438-1, partial [Araneus ventricosus]
MTSGVAR